MPDHVVTVQVKDAEALAANIDKIQRRKPVEKWLSYEPPKLPTPCTPADLTPTMRAAMPEAMRAEFCTAYNLYTGTWPAGLGFDFYGAFFATLDYVRWIRGWCQMPDGSYQREAADGTVEKAGKVLSSRNEERIREIARLAEALLASAVKTTEEPAEVGKAAVFKVNEDRRTITGWAYPTKVAGEVVKDADGEWIATEPTMLDAVQGYVAKSREGNDGKHKTPSVATCVEAFCIRPEVSELLKAGKEGFLVTIRYDDTPEGDVAWAQVKKDAAEGKMPMFSIEGNGDIGG